MAWDDKLSFCATQTDLGLDLVLIIQVCANFSIKPRVSTVGMECNGVLSTELCQMVTGNQIDIQILNEFFVEFCVAPHPVWQVKVHSVTAEVIMLTK